MSRRSEVRSRSFAVTLSVLGLLALIAGACVPPPPEPATGTSANDAPRAGDAAYVEPGPYGVGVTTVALSDRQMEVWYPTDPEAVEGLERDAYYVRDFVPSWLETLLPADVNPPFVTDAVRGVAASSDGPFPLALFSHGFAGFRLTSTALTTHLASWGFVVIAPDYLERGLQAVLGEPPAGARSDLTVAAEAIDAAKNASAAPGNLLEGVIDSTRVFPFGHSAGGGTSLRLLSRPDVPAAVPMAAGITELSLIDGTAPKLTADKAVTWIGARGDGIASIGGVRLGFEYTAGQRRLIELNRAGHNNAFTDLCEIGDGGIAAIARATGLPIPAPLLALGDDGCQRPPNAPGPQVWDEVRHFLTAELRFRAGLDPEPVGLGDSVLSNFDDVATYRHNP